IVSVDILTTDFLCDVARCKGICCVEGNAGAPLEMDEMDVLEELYPIYEKYMTPEGREAIERDGFAVVDIDGDLTTPLVNDAECAYSYNEGGVTLCAIEKAYLAGECSWRKPISCHLYPIRVAKFSNGTYGLNFHRWNVCASAFECGRKMGVPAYKMLKEAITRAFGEDFYAALEAAEEHIKSHKE
ncbi:MAG: DUF3109 family protein, partial [Rikenellaceae bacterium]|nr:DUF3109 family protein [Rikenellaceae bacterium]